jgi:hypothetical protein
MLDNVNTTTMLPFVVTNSTVTILLRGNNTLTAKSDGVRMQCNNRSGLKFQLFDGTDTLTVSGGRVGSAQLEGIKSVTARTLPS